MLGFTEDVTPPIVPPVPPHLHPDAITNPPPPSEVMPEVSSDTSSLIRKKLALISISPSPSTSSTPKRPYSDDTNVSVELEHQSSSSLPRKVIKKSMEGYLGCWPMVCGCKVLYRLRRVESIIKITGGGTTMEVPFNKEYVHFDCPCGCRCEFTMNVGSLKKKPKLEKMTAAAAVSVAGRSNAYTQTSQRPVLVENGGKESCQQVSDDTKMPVGLEHQSSSSPPRKVIKKSMQGHIGVLYRIRRVESITKIAGGGTTIEVPFNKEYVHFDCPCGCRCELTMGAESGKRPKRK